MKRKSVSESEKNNVIFGYGERIKLAAKNVNGASALSRMINVPRNTLQRYVSEETEPPISVIANISKATKTSLVWLATGEGSPHQGFSDINNKTNCDDFTYPDEFSGKKKHLKSEITPPDELKRSVPVSVAQDASTALYSYLINNNHSLSAEEFGEAVALICDFYPNNGEIDISLVKRLMKFKGD